MRLRMALLALLAVCLTVTAAQAARPAWDNWPEACELSTPVCFFEFDPGTTVWDHHRR